jgi:hypothetical protein
MLNTSLQESWKQRIGIIIGMCNANKQLHELSCHAEIM